MTKANPRTWDSIPTPRHPLPRIGHPAPTNHLTLHTIGQLPDGAYVV